MFCARAGQYECDIAFDKLIAHPTEGEHESIAPIRILSFDIECAGRPGAFPDPKEVNVF